MLPESEFQALIRSIVTECVPDEVDVLDLGGDELVREVYQTGRPPADKASAAEFEFVSGVEGFLKLVPVALATYRTLKEFLRPSPKPVAVTQELVLRDWTLKLQAVGLPPDLTAEVTARFSQLVAEVAARHAPAAGPSH